MPPVDPDGNIVKILFIVFASLLLCLSKINFAQSKVILQVDNKALKTQQKY